MLFEGGLFFQIFRLMVIIISILGMQASITVFKPALKQNLLLLCGYIGYCFLMCALLVPTLGLLPFIRFSPFIITIPGIYVLYRTADVPLSQHIFTVATQFIIASYITASVTLVNTRLGSSPFIHILSLMIAYLSVTLLEVILIRRIYLRIIATIKQGGWLFSVLSCALLVLVLSFSRFPKHYTESTSGSILLYALGAAIIVIYVAIFNFLKIRDDLSIQERNREILNLQIQNIRKSTADSRRKAEIAKKVRQDSFILLQDIADLAKAENWDAIHEAVDNETAKNDSRTPVSYCSDPILNATLDSYLGRAQNSGITLETSIHLPKDLPSCSTKFSICLANSLENAIKACEKLPKNDRKIIVKCTGSPKLMFEIKNTYKDKVAFTRDGVPISPTSGHGIGTRSIIAFCEKHDALYSFKAEGGWFQVTVAL